MKYITFADKLEPMTAKEYLTSLHVPNDGISPYQNLSEQECLDKLIESHKRIRGHYVYFLEKPLKQLNDSVMKVYSEITKF